MIHSVVVDDLAELVRAPTRVQLWVQFVLRHDLKTIAELGVFKGEFAEAPLKSCPLISTYYLIDPWRHLADWNKAANKDDQTFEGLYEEVLTRTQPWESKRVVLRGRTAEVAHAIPQGSLDFAYVDADHTLRGITIDLIQIWPKVSQGGFVGGDDFCPSAWQHPKEFARTLVYPFAVYFAEAMDVPIVALPHNQFPIQKAETGFSFSDTTGKFLDPTLRGVFSESERRHSGRGVGLWVVDDEQCPLDLVGSGPPPPIRGSWLVQGVRQRGRPDVQ